MSILKNARHELFARQVADGIPQGDAFVAAGYSPATASAGAARLVKNCSVSARICELRVKSVADSRIDAAFLLTHLGDMLKADIGDIIEKETVEGPAVRMIVNDETGKPHLVEQLGPPLRVKGDYRPIQEWPLIWRQMLRGCDIETHMERSKDGVWPNWDIAARVVKIKFLDRLKTIELTGNHKAVDAFVQQQRGAELHLHLHQEVESRLTRAREIAAAHAGTLPVRTN